MRATYQTAARATPGLSIAIATAAAGFLVESWVPVFGAAVVALALGLTVRTLSRNPRRVDLGSQFAAKQGLQIAIVLLGAGLDLRDILAIGASSSVVLGTVAIVGLGAMWLLGKAARIDWAPRSLITVGTVVCGGTAIGALAPAIRARSDDVALAISVVFGMNFLGLLVFPPLQGMIGLDQAAFGIWVGAAIHDTSSVVAAAYSVGVEAGDVATIVKLTRTTLIVPLVLGFGLWAGRRAASDERFEKSAAIRGLPSFLIWFIIAAALKSAGVIDSIGLTALPEIGRHLMIVALAGVGLSTNLGAVRRAGPRPFIAGAVGWGTMALVGLASLAFTDAW